MAHGTTDSWEDLETSPKKFLLRPKYLQCTLYFISSLPVTPLLRLRIFITIVRSFIQRSWGVFYKFWLVCITELPADVRHSIA